MSENIFSSSDIEIKEISDEINKIMKNEFDNMAGISWQELIQTAKFFIQRCDQLSNLNISMSQFNLLSNAMGLIRKSNQQLILLQASYVYAFWFDDKLKQFRNQVPNSALFVLENKKGYLSTYELPLMSLIRYLNADDKNRLNASRKQLSKEFENARKEDIFNKEHVEQAQAAYSGVSNRLEEYWKKVGGQRQDGILLWKENHDWVAGKVLNKGDLREAYAAALITQHKSKLDKLCSVSKGTPKYYSHDLIKVFFHEHIEKVSNAAAIQNEDIITANKQYAVKSFRAELPSLNQYYNAAKWIVENQQATKKQLEDELMKGGEAFRNKFLGSINSDVEDFSNEIIDSAIGKFYNQK